MTRADRWSMLGFGVLIGALIIALIALAATWQLASAAPTNPFDHLVCFPAQRYAGGRWPLVTWEWRCHSTGAQR